MLTLADIAPGKSARVIDVTGDDNLAARIMEMGIYEGELVKVVGIAPLGDPMDLEVQGYRLSLRKAEAKRITVHTDPAPN
ncbi:MAG: ferrous iron transport protein A [Pirellulales bacterium]|jgi:ferrous iron transport protein A